MALGTNTSVFVCVCMCVCVCVYVCVCVGGLARLCQEINRVVLKITPRYVNYKENTRASADIDICKSRETPLSVPFWNEY